MVINKVGIARNSKCSLLFQRFMFGIARDDGASCSVMHLMDYGIVLNGKLLLIKISNVVLCH